MCEWGLNLKRNVTQIRKVVKISQIKAAHTEEQRNLMRGIIGVYE